jgi:hypothetical protein
VIYGGVRIDATAAWTFLLGIPKSRSLSQHYAHLEFHAWFHHACKLRWANYLVVFSANHCIVAPLDEMNSGTVSAMNPDNIVEILGREVV